MCRTAYRESCSTLSDVCLLHGFLGALQRTILLSEPRPLRHAVAAVQGVVDAVADALHLGLEGVDVRRPSDAMVGVRLAVVWPIAQRGRVTRHLLLFSLLLVAHLFSPFD